MAGAYTAFPANGGMWVKPRILRNQPSDAHQAMDPRVAYVMVNMLEEVLRSGTAAGVRSRGFNLPAAGKTGTSHDGWFAGFTSQLLCVVWVGFDKSTVRNSIWKARNPLFRILGRLHEESRAVRALPWRNGIPGSQRDRFSENL